MTLSENTLQAIRDYHYLLEKGYPDKRTLDLVAHRYMLGRTARAVLFRGVFKSQDSGRRRTRLIRGGPPDCGLLKVDGLNQLFSIASYLSGRLVFIASDGVLRDASEIHGAAIGEGLTRRSVDLVKEFAERHPALRIEFFLDVKANAFHAAREALVQGFSTHPTDVKIIGSAQVDADLAAHQPFLLATSDSVIIDRSVNPVFDLARFILEQKFSGKIPDFHLLLG